MSAEGMSSTQTVSRKKHGAFFFFKEPLCTESNSAEISNPSVYFTSKKQTSPPTTPHHTLLPPDPFGETLECFLNMFHLLIHRGKQVQVATFPTWLTLSLKSKCGHDMSEVISSFSENKICFFFNTTRAQESSLG